MNNLTKGFTFIELLIVISVSALLTTFGYSAYRKTEERQQGLMAFDEISNIFYTVQKKATVGEHNCTNSSLSGYSLTFNNDGTITYQGLCSNGQNMTATTTNIKNSTYFDNESITFLPLTGNIDISTQDVYIDFTTPANQTHSVVISKPGSIRYQP